MTPPGERWHSDEKSVHKDYFDSGVSEFLSSLMFAAAIDTKFADAKPPSRHQPNL
jgi:hypothetical protein